MLMKWFAVAGVGWGLMGLQALLAHMARRLTTAQMQADGVSVGINFSNHGSTRWVIFALVPLMATLVALYADQWSWERWTVALMIGIIISVPMHLSWTFAPYPDFMVAGPWKPSLAAYPHIVLFVGVVAILVLTYTGTARLSPLMVQLTAAYITWHVFVGNHMLRKTFPPAGFPPYEFWDPGPIGIICLVGIIMTGATVYALR